MTVITSLTNQKVKQWQRYKQRKHRYEDRVFLVEGEHLIEMAHEVGLLKELWVVENYPLPFAFEHVFISPQHVIDKLSQLQSPSSMIGLCAMPNYTIDAPKRLFLCDTIQDPGNLGTIIRTALAFDFDGIICSEHCVDFTSDKVIRASQGAIFKMPVVIEKLEDTIPVLQADGVHVVALTLSELAKQHVESFDKMAFILGNEGQGIQDEILKLADAHLKINIAHIDSLNVAISAGIIAYEYQSKEQE